MLYHQKSLAVRSPGRLFRAVSQSLSPWTSRLLWRQSMTSLSSRKYQPLATMPCSRGSKPVSSVDCIEHVTAGTIGESSATNPSRPSAASPDASRSSMPLSSPTTRITTSGGASLTRSPLAPKPLRHPCELRGDAGNQPRVVLRALVLGQHGPRIGFDLEVGHRTAA